MCIYVCVYVVRCHTIVMIEVNKFSQQNEWNQYLERKAKNGFDLVQSVRANKK